MNKRKGISLIVLVITILVMIILAGVVVVSLSKNNPIEKAKEANFKTDVSSFASELGVGLSNSLVENSSVKPEEIFANKFVDMKKYINSFSKKYENKLVIADGKLTYIGGDSKEEKWSEECGIEVFKGVNKPVLSEGMIPVKYENNSWVICSENDPSWYNYGQKLWANVMLSDGKYKDKNLVGTSVADGDLGSMFVWIPRFAYSINKYKTPVPGTEGQTQEIHDISFLLGTSDNDIDGKKYSKFYDAKNAEVGKPTTPIVHPAFSFAGEEKQGIWVAKFEASMNEDGTEHTNDNSIASCNFVDANNSMIKVIPGKVTWRYIDVGNIFFNCYNIKKSGNIYGLTNVDSHLIKNIEWGAVTNLSTSKYGQTPTFSNNHLTAPDSTYPNGYIEWSGGGENNNYKMNKTQSTTGNETGIYDMNGGSWEYTAGYFNNKNRYLSEYGKQDLFKGNVLESKYKYYFDEYAPGLKESNPVIHDEMWNRTYNDPLYGNTYRKEATKERFEQMAKVNGDAVYETILEGKYAFFGKKSADNGFSWMTDVLGSGWQPGIGVYNKDYALIGVGYLPFILRGGIWGDNEHAGIFATHCTYGDGTYYNGFRPVIINN